MVVMPLWSLCRSFFGLYRLQVGFKSATAGGPFVSFAALNVIGLFFLASCVTPRRNEPMPPSQGEPFTHTKYTNNS